MDHVYALGVSIIEIIQEWLEDYDEYFEIINNVSNPHHTLEILFPLMSIVDSVFSAQLVLCMAFGGWLNAVMKWWLLEDRPFWWVHETDYYEGSDRPIVRQTSQTCETGPGSPSGHSETAAMLLVLTVCWIEHFMTDRKLSLVRWWKYVWYPLCGASLGGVMLARLFIGAHFPHQVFFGALLGGFLAPFLCIYVVDPFIWQYSPYDKLTVRFTVFCHTVSAVCTILISIVTYFATSMCGFDPMWTVKLAFRWCEQPELIHVSTTPMYALVHCTGHLMGWALCVTPAVAKYRHYTKSRSLIIAAISTGCIIYALRLLQKGIPTDNAFVYYALLFSLCAIKVPLLLRAVPALAMWPYDQSGASPEIAREKSPKLRSKSTVTGKVRSVKNTIKPKMQ